MVHLIDWFSGSIGSIGLMVQLDQLAQWFNWIDWFSGAIRLIGSVVQLD